MGVEPLAMCYPGLAGSISGQFQVCPKDLASAVRQSERAANRPNGLVGALIGIGEEVPHARHEAARVHCSGRCG
jgi:hypothetical protein